MKKQHRLLPIFLVAITMPTALLANTAPTVVIKSAAMRPGTGLMDIVFRVNDPDDATVKTRALAFQYGSRAFHYAAYNSAYSTLIRPSAFVEGTGGKIGDSVQTNTDHLLTWDVASDWNVQLGQVTFEVLAMDNRGLMPIEWITIPAAAGRPEITISKNSPTDAQVMDAFFWLYASGDEDLVMQSDGLRGGSSAGDFYSGCQLVAYSTPGVFARPFLYKKMNLAVAEIDVIAAAQSARAGVGSGWLALKKPYEGFTAVVGWGNTGNSAAITGAVNGAVAIAAAGSHSLVLKADGTVLAFGPNYSSEVAIPSGLTSVSAVAAGPGYSLALKTDGTVHGWGQGVYGQPDGLSGVASIGAGPWAGWAVKGDGSFVSWGSFQSWGFSSSDLAGVAAAAQGYEHSVILREDGGIKVVGGNLYGQTNTPSFWDRVKSVAAGSYHTMAMLENGSVVVWGAGKEPYSYSASWPHKGQSSPGWASGDAYGVFWGAVAIAAGSTYSLFLKSDGTVEAWGSLGTYNTYGPPTGLGSIIAIAAGDSHALALTKTDTP
jgi:hypothetical protein